MLHAVMLHDNHTTVIQEQVELDEIPTNELTMWTRRSLRQVQESACCCSWQQNLLVVRYIYDWFQIRPQNLTLCISVRRISLICLE